MREGREGSREREGREGRGAEGGRPHVMPQPKPLVEIWSINVIGSACLPSVSRCLCFVVHFRLQLNLYLNLLYQVGGTSCSMHVQYS